MSRPWTEDDEARTLRHMPLNMHNLRLLATGNVTVTDCDTGVSTVTRPGRGFIWKVLVKPRSNDWWWVRRYGAMDCGCTRNPITRHMVLYRSDCPEHCVRPRPGQTA